MSRRRKRPVCVRVDPGLPEPIVIIGQGDGRRVLTGHEPMRGPGLGWLWLALVPVVVWCAHWLDTRDAR